MNRAAEGRGRGAFLVGEPGVGKSRLVREVSAFATARGLLVLAGRAVPGDNPLPFRPLTEALVSAGRGRPAPDGPELTGFAAQLARLVPDWGTGSGTDGADDSPVLIGEAVVRLLRVLGGTGGCLLVLEDLHWADSETLAVVEYLADAVSTERLLCLATTRPVRPSPAADLLDRLTSRRTVSVFSLQPLLTVECTLMMQACLSGADVSDDMAAFVVEHSDGFPFLIEELLAGLVSSGTLTRRDGHWRVERRLTPSVPGSFAASVHIRLARLSNDERRVLSAAAVLGRRFDWDLLPGVAGVDGSTVVEALRAAVDAQFLEVEGQAFRFRHALTREAVLGELLPPERAELAAGAVAAVERAHPGVPGAWCDLAAELSLAAGDRAAAAALTVESARRALSRGALASAELTIERAYGLAPQDSGLSADAQEVWVTVLARAGKPAAARTIGLGLLGRLVELGEPADRQVALLLDLARGALAAGEAQVAAADVSRAEELTGAGAGARACMDAVGAHVALAQHRMDDARRLAASAVAAAAPVGRHDVQCEALEVLGRLAQTTAEATATIQRAVDLAEQHGLTTWQLRALQELAIIEVWSSGSGRVMEVRRVAADAGAHFTVAQMDLVMADRALVALDRKTCLDAAQRCVDASRRYGLASLPVALLWLAGAHALAGREAEMEAVLTEAAAAAPGDARIQADAWGRVRAIHWALRENRPALQHALDRSMDFTRAAPESESLYPGQILWALLRALCDDDLGESAREELARSRIGRANSGVLAIVDAVILGRQGYGEDAAAALTAA
ncbi:MAG TPA: AAA family ATPase, partial [Dermatophilaceae bacterium]